MEDRPFEKVITVTQLRLDTENPRLPDIEENQHDAMRAMVEAQKNKVVALARHLVNNGPNPANLPIVMPSEEGEGIYHLLDGNRRLVALKLLEDPSLAEGILSSSALKRLRQLSIDFSSDAITELSCVVVADRDEADKWIQLIHRGEKQGAGLVEWDGQVAARYDARKGTKSVALQVLDFVRGRAALSETARERIDSGRFPITNLSRLVNTPYVRSKLGVEKDAGKALTYHPDDEVLKGLTRVVEDIGNRTVTVSDIKSQAQRIQYINSFEATELPDPATKMDTPEPLGEAVRAEKAKKVAREPEERSVPVRRSRLIPKSCILKINQHRINRLYAELKRLPLNDFPNAGAVLLRVFVELSVDHYLEHRVGWSDEKIRGSYLAQKLTGTANDLEQRSLMTPSQLAPIRKAVAGQTLLASSVKTMHGYVHSRYFSAIPSELITAWDDLQPFLEQLWSTL